ncbi:hypothetical protein PoB_003388600 [Plakobranchus ocellatus]|uniref:Uncharacterized protein n=1 Tax=Plakobranchus ocellatus TaxID=259542 RepID=A0AAV4ALC8_9GAST|nr:hypothetical protein PoB_003388600 [Plakobranchus ocellatus]
MYGILLCHKAQSLFNDLRLFGCRRPRTAEGFQPMTELIRAPVTLTLCGGHTRSSVSGSRRRDRPGVQSLGLCCLLIFFYQASEAKDNTLLYKTVPAQPSPALPSSRQPPRLPQLKLLRAASYDPVVMMKGKSFLHASVSDFQAGKLNLHRHHNNSRSSGILRPL